jgi:ATP-dependent helicase/DNAse subunit B
MKATTQVEKSLYYIVNSQLSLSGQKKLLESLPQSATFDAAIVHKFFDNPNRSTPTKHFDRRGVKLRLSENLV